MKKIFLVGHLGTKQTKMNAKSTAYWPNIYKDIGKFIGTVNSYELYRKSNL